MRALASLAATAAVAAVAVTAGAAPAPAAPGDQSPSGVRSTAAGVRAWGPHVGEARRYAKRRAGSVSFAISDQCGRERGYRARRTAPLASVNKVMFMTAYLSRKRIRTRRLRPPDRRLLAPMIRRSDNATATRVRDIVGGRALRRLARRAGMRRYRAVASPWGLSSSSAIDQVRLMRRLGPLLPARHRAYAKRLLARIVGSQRWGVGRVPHRGWRLMFKGGWGSGSGWVDHQVALLEGRGRRLSVAVLTRDNPGHAYGKRTLRGVFGRLLDGLPAPGRLAGSGCPRG